MTYRQAVMMSEDLTFLLVFSLSLSNLFQLGSLTILRMLSDTRIGKQA